MSREVHVRNCEGVGGKFPCATLLVLGFEYQQDAEKVMETLPKRMNKYSLTIHPEKSKLFEFVPTNKSKDRTLEFLGFTHYWTKSQRGKTVIKRKTSKKGLRKSIKKLTDCCRYNRHDRLKEQYKLLSSKVRGLYQYYGIRGNFKSLATIYNKALLLWYKWLNRRSQHNSYTMEGYKMLLKHFPLPKPKIIHWKV